MPFSVRTIHNCVVVVTFKDTPTVETWPQYEHCFTRVYEKYAQFIVVFDVSGMGIPPFQLISKKKQLIVDMKPKTVRQVLANIVFTPNETVRDVIVALVRAAGQSSPFYAFSDTQSVVKAASRLVRLIKGFPMVDVSPPETLVWGDLSFTSRVALITFAILRSLTAIVKPCHRVTRS